MSSSKELLEQLTGLKKEYRNLWNFDGSKNLSHLKDTDLWSEMVDRLEQEIEGLEKQGILHVCTRCGVAEEGVNYGFGHTLKCQSCLEETGLC